MSRIAWKVGVTVLLLGSSAAWAAAGPSASVLPLHHDALVVESPQASERLRCFCPTPSTRNLLQLERPDVFKPGIRTASAKTAGPLKILGIRVEFPLEGADDLLTTGQGRFDMRDTAAYFEATGHHFDSAPHGRLYFEAHLRALHLYWATVSNDQVTLEGTVFPRAADSVYQLPPDRPMSFYGRERTGDSGVTFGLRQFVIDAATSASASDPALRFSDYDAVIIFHAGSDRQSDILQDSPRDLFTGFLRLDSTLYLRSGTDSLVEAIIMPETEIQDGRITVLNGVMAHEFGHQLGLVDLYNTRNFMTQIGNFSLMDNNASDVGVRAAVSGRERIIFGALPVFPDAWSRAYLGFVSVTTVTDSSRVPVPTAERFSLVPQSFSQVLRVPISSTEYYLVENRRTDIDDLGDPGLRLDSVTNVVLEPVDTRVVLPSREYDFLLPGNGLLIWHVDEGVASLDYATSDDVRNNFLANTLQWDPHRRFVRLIEADGIVNFGGYYSSGTGTSRDYFFDPNKRELSASTNPPAVSNTGGATGIRLFNISGPSNDMKFDVTVTGRLPGFPVYTGPERSDAAAPVVTDITLRYGEWMYPGDGHPEIFTAYHQYILGWNWNGTPIGMTEVPDTVVTFDTSRVVDTLAIVAEGAPDDSGWIAPPMVGDFDGEGGAELVTVSRTGRVYQWVMADRDSNGLFDLKRVAQTTGRPVGPPVILEQNAPFKKLLVPVEGSHYDLISLTTDTSSTHSLPGALRGVAGRNDYEAIGVFRTVDSVWLVGSIFDALKHVAIEAESLLTPALGDLNHDGKIEAVVLDVGGRLWALDTAAFAPLDGFPVRLDYAPVTSPVLADLNRDGYLDIITAGGGAIYAYAHNGALLPNFPVTIGQSNMPDTAVATPVVGDFGETSLLSLIAGGSNRAVYGFAGNGREEGGFPLAVGGEVDAPPAHAINAAANQAAVFTRAADGYLYAYEVPMAASPSQAVWPMASHDPLRTATVPPEDLDPKQTYAQFFAPEKAFVYPNPAQDRAIVRYWLGDDADVHIKIFDLAGNLVRETDGPGTGGAYNEWTWECATVASGVYFAHLEVVSKSSGRHETALCKLSVVQ